jgi:hypothetical protein
MPHRDAPGYVPGSDDLTKPYEGGPEGHGFTGLGQWWKALQGPTGVQALPTAPSPAGEMDLEGLFGDEMPIQGGITPTWRDPDILEAVEAPDWEQANAPGTTPGQSVAALASAVPPRKPNIPIQPALPPAPNLRTGPGRPEQFIAPANPTGSSILPIAPPSVDPASGRPEGARGMGGLPIPSSEAGPLAEFFASALQSGDQGQIMQILQGLPDFLRESILGPLIPGGAINRSNVPAAPLSESERQLTPGASAPGAGSPF